MKKNTNILETILLLLSSSIFVLSSVGLIFSINHLIYINSSYTISYNSYPDSYPFTWLMISLFAIIALVSLILFIVLDWTTPEEKEDQI